MTISQMAESSKFGSVTYGTENLNASKMQNESRIFENLISQVKEESKIENVGKNVSSSQIVESGHLNGDWKSDFSGIYTSESDKNSNVVGAAANSSSYTSNKKIDRTSKLYEKSLELESYFVKMLVTSMRKTVTKTTENSFAQNMYEDMMYDEYTTVMTKNANFGLADQIYLELSV